MTPHARCLPRFALGLVALLTLLPACSPKITAPPEPPYSVRRGDEAFRYEDYPGAIGSYRSYLDESAQDPYTPRVFYKTALAQYRLGHYHETLGTLGELDQRYPSRNWVQVDALRGDAERELHRPMAALQAWDDAWPIANENDRSKLRQRIVSLSRGLSDAELAQGQRLVDTEEVRLLLEQQIANRQPDIDEQMPEDVDGSVASAPAAKPQPMVTRDASLAMAEEEPELVAPAPEAEEFDEHTAPVGGTWAAIAEAEKAPDGQPKVACLLPLSGASQEAGERSLRGLRLLFGENSERLLVLDSGDSPAAAAQRFNQLSHNPDVLAVIGPLRGEDAEAVAPLARKAQMPLLLLSQRDGLAGGSVLQLGTTRSQLMETLLQYSTGKLRMRRFGILYPEDAYGRQYAEAFRADVKRHGGSIIGAEGYSPQTRALPAATLKRWRDTDHLQAVFLPDNVTMARALAQILQRDMPDVTLIGANDWGSIAQEGDHLNGVLFADGFYSGSQRPWTQQFVERFEATYGNVPGGLEAQAYDAGLLVVNALRDGAGSRAEVLRALQAQGPIEGATGLLHVTPTGLQRQVFLLQVYDDKVGEVGDRND